MKFNATSGLLCLILPIAFAETANAATALIDFGTANAPGPYNLVPMPPSAAADSGIIALMDTTATATGWSVNVLETGTGNGGTAGAGANVTSFPAGLAGFDSLALQDSIFANQGGGTAPSMVVTFTGLSPASSYDLLLYGSRANGQGVDQIWSLTQGAAASDVTHNSELNDTVFVDWPGVSPNGSGVIEVTISTGADSAGALALNFASISQVPEPSAALLLGLSGVALLIRRRR